MKSFFFSEWLNFAPAIKLPPFCQFHWLLISVDAMQGNKVSRLNDRDPDGDPLTVTHFTWNDQSFTAGSSATIAGVGTLTVGSDGRFLFTPAQDYADAVPVASCTVSDGRGQVSVSTLTLSITPVNDAPVMPPQAPAAFTAPPVR